MLKSIIKTIAYFLTILGLCSVVAVPVYLIILLSNYWNVLSVAYQACGIVILIFLLLFFVIMLLLWFRETREKNK